MKNADYKFVRTQVIPIPVREAWNFFSNPHNLVRLTPVLLEFRILSNPPEKLEKDLVIEYGMKMFGRKMKWVSKITDVNAPYHFTDEQVQGPYAYWHHLHQFKEVFGGVEVVDTVTYRVPFQNWLPFINSLIVEKKLKEIFDFRQQMLEVLFGK